MLEMDIKADGDFICDVSDVVEATNGDGSADNVAECQRLRLKFCKCNCSLFYMFKLHE